MFILSMGLILSLGFIIGFVLNKIKVPGLVGMILVGMAIGPYALDWICPGVLSISADLRKIALVIILTRSGLNLDLESLKKVGRPAILLCFVPATFEIIGVTLGAYLLLDLSILEGILLGCVLAAVSPAVVSPRMIKLIENGLGEEKQIPKMILAGSSVDDIYVIVLFYVFLGINQSGSFNGLMLLDIPVSIISGISLGLLVGFLISLLFKYTNFKVVINLLITLCASFLMLGFEVLMEDYFSISALLAIIVMSMFILFKNKPKAKELSVGYNNLWLVFEIILFVLVGATIDVKYAINNFGFGLLVLVIGLIFRMVGVFLCLLGTNLNFKERLFVGFAYIAKATVQASIGGIALSAGLDCGSIVLTVSVLSILITAPLGAFLIDMLAPKLLISKPKQETLVC